MRRLFVPTNTERLALYCSLSLFSIIGEIMRICLEQVFGQACHTNPDDVDWNQSRWAPCVTDPGTTASTGGGLFIDLPANMLGCFIIGFFISGDEYLGIPVDIPVVFLPRDSRLQKWTICLVGIRTGLCGSLTTFASWNTQMVVMICNGKGTVLSSQWVSALFGYMIGLGMAFHFFGLGRHAAVAIHRYNNPDLAKEADRMAGRRPGALALFHRSFPDYERRFLHSITMENTILRKELSALEDQEEATLEDDANSGTIHKRTSSSRVTFKGSPLQRWKDTTDNHRHGRVADQQWHAELREIENAILLKDEDPREELMEVARDGDWDVEALIEWKNLNTGGKSGQQEHHHRVQREFMVLAPFLVVAVSLLVWGAIAAKGSTDEQTHSYQVSCLSALIAPAGTFCRYLLSNLNGTITNRRWEWLPLGTLIANLTACVISALMVGLKVQGQSDVVNLWLGALKGGFAGCLSTVSTFITECSGLMRALPRQAWGYYYCAGSMILACILGVCSYVWAVV